MPRRFSAYRSRITAIVLVTALGLSLPACTAAPEPEPSPSTSATTAPTPEPPTFQPDGTAEDNLPIFTSVTAEVWAASGSESGRAYIDALVAAGFDKAAMQVTQELTTVSNPVESLQFSVRWGDDKCLVGQVGPSTGEPVTMVMAQLAEGRCLIGKTRQIDW